MRKYLLIILIFLVNTSLFAQANCERNLNEARSDYANGNLYAIPGKLDECLKNGFSKNEMIEAYQLLALTYININQQDKAKESMIKLLKLQTDYQVIKNVDPDELYSLYQSIETDPIYFIGAYFTFNYSIINVSDSGRFTSDSDPNAVDNYNYTPALSIAGGAHFLYPINKSWYASGKLGYDVHRYDYDETNKGNVESENETTVSYTSINRGINLSTSLRYMLDRYSYKPFIELGATGRFNFVNSITNYLNEEEEAPPFSVNEYRKAFNLGFSVDAGTLIKVSENYLSLSLGASYFVIPEVDYSNNVNGRSFYSLAGRHVVQEDTYNKLILNFTVKFNIPFYNFK